MIKPALEVGAKSIMSYGYDLLDEYEREVPNTFGYTLDKDNIRHSMLYPPLGQEIFYYMKDDQIIGMIWLHKATLLIANEPYVGDVLFYVKKEFRGQVVAAALIHKARVWAREQGAVSFQMGAFSGIDKRAEGLYSKMGMEHFGTTWIQQL